MMQLQLLSMPVPSPKAAVAGGEGQLSLGRKKKAVKGGSPDGNAEKCGNYNGKAETYVGNAVKDGSYNGRTSATYGISGTSS